MDRATFIMVVAFTGLIGAGVGFLLARIVF
jgi:hypothetical protein